MRRGDCIHHGAGEAIHADTPPEPACGWNRACVSSHRRNADHGVTVAVEVNTDVGIADEESDLVPALDAALADLANGAVR